MEQTNRDPRLYPLLEKLLQEADKPLTCVELFDNPEVRERAIVATRVSDYLGGLFRKGKASRTPAPRTANDNSRWAYSWRKQSPSRQPAEETVDDYRITGHQALLNKPNIQITDQGGAILIDLPHLTITIKVK